MGPGYSMVLADLWALDMPWFHLRGGRWIYYGSDSDKPWIYHSGWDELWVYLENTTVSSLKRGRIRNQGKCGGRTTLTVCECKIQTQPGTKPDMVKPVSWVLPGESSSLLNLDFLLQKFWMTRSSPRPQRLQDDLGAANCMSNLRKEVLSKCDRGRVGTQHVASVTLALTLNQKPVGMHTL